MSAGTTLTRTLAALGLAAATLVATSAAPTAAYDEEVIERDTVRIGDDRTYAYFPADATGELPVALLLQGGKVHMKHYSEYAAEIASYGFIVVTPNHERLNFVDYDYYTSTIQISETLDWMAEENAKNRSPLKGRIDEDTLVLLGHSFGGATGLSIAESKCSIPFCSGITFTLPSEVKAASFYGTNNALLGIHPSIDNKIPVQLVQGLDDGTATPTAAENTYAKMKATKQIVRLSGANHYGLTNRQDPPGANDESQPQSLTQAESIEASARWAAQFLLAQLGDTAAADYVYTTGDAADDLVTVSTAR